MSLRLSIPCSLSLSLSHTHTHTFLSSSQVITLLKCTFHVHYTTTTCTKTKPSHLCITNTPKHCHSVPKNFVSKLWFHTLFWATTIVIIMTSTVGLLVQGMESSPHKSNHNSLPSILIHHFLPSTQVVHKGSERRTYSRKAAPGHCMQSVSNMDAYISQQIWSRSLNYHGNGEELLQLQ